MPDRHPLHAEWPVTDGADLPRLRHRITELCWHYLPDVDQYFLADLHMICTELASNTIEHAVGPRTVRITLCRAEEAGVTVLIEAEDHSPGLEPTVGRSSLGSYRGRGLTLVSRLAERWGIRRHPDRKTVWARLNRPRDGEPGAPGRAATPPTPASGQTSDAVRPPSRT